MFFENLANFKIPSVKVQNQFSKNLAHCLSDLSSIKITECEVSKFIFFFFFLEVLDCKHFHQDLGRIFVDKDVIKT